MENEFKMKKRAERHYKTLCVEVIQYLPSRELVLGGLGAVAMGKYLEVFQHCFRGIFACNTLKAIICCLCRKGIDLCLLCLSWHVCCPWSWVGWDCCFPRGLPGGTRPSPPRGLTPTWARSPPHGSLCARSRWQTRVREWIRKTRVLRSALWFL